MDFHDAYARTTPFELVFPDPADAEALWSAADQESVGRGAEVRNPASFLMLGSVASSMRRLQEPGVPATVAHQYGALLFHATHFAHDGRCLYLMENHVARYLVDASVEGPSPTAPAPSGYLQLPRNLFWVRPAPDEPAEPVDGIHWTMGSGDFLHCLLALGMRHDRPGLAVVTVPEAPFGDAGAWLQAQVRDEGRDYETTLPGGELEGLLSLETAGEVLKLVARFFRYLEAHADAVRAEAPVTDPEGPTPSALPFSRVTLNA